MGEKLKIWFNQERQSIEVFDNNGEIIQGLGKVVINDGWPGKKITATIEVQVDIVIERPEPKDIIKMVVYDPTVSDLKHFKP